ncbi:MAG: alpha-amylase [Cytophagia bacterium]|nr:alpha-amylase [Cytophagia bacterium]
MKKQIIGSLIVVMTLAGACKQEEKVEVPFPYGVKYEVFVMAFADSNGDGKGDLKGLTQKLDYFSELGVNGLWLMPIMPSDTYHKYHVMDYKGIDPDYGTLDDFKTFIAEAHKRNIKVISDYIINHTGDKHPWFLESIKGKDNPFRDYYVWAPKDSVELLQKDEVPGPDTDNAQRWHEVPGDTSGEMYYGYFNGQTPDLNFDNPKVRQEIYDAARFWLVEVGVDGFRLDAAKHIFPNNRAKDNHSMWQEFRAEIQKMKPDAYLVGEVWSDSKTVAPYLKGLPSLFNFDLGYLITDVVKSGNDTIGLVKKYKAINDYYTSITPDFLDATFVKNHDQLRILSELGGNIEKAKLAAGILFTFPGTPYLYQGEEIGMLGQKEDMDRGQRESFIWAEGKTDPLQSNWYNARFSTDKTVVPFSKQKDDPSSIYNYYKKFIAFRNSSKALTQGSIEESGLQINEVLNFTRKHQQEECWVLHNVSDVEVTVQIPDHLKRFTTLVYQTQNASLAESAITLPAYSSAILK